MKVFDSILDDIGRTPLVSLRRLYRGPGRLVAKAEYLQPGGSIKDRSALKVIELARQTGKLREKQPVVEMTSGNMGAGLAIVCGVLGHPFVAVMSAGNSPERARMMRMLGAEVVLVPQVDGVPGQVTGRDIDAAAARAREIAATRDGYYVDQFAAIGCVLAHEEGTGPEIVEQLGGFPSAFAASVGTGGTFMGCARFLRKSECYAVEPAGAEFLAGAPITKPRHRLQGTGYCVKPKHWDPSLVDGFLSVTDEEAEATRNELAATEGIYVGYSSGANVAAALKLLRERNDPAFCVATILCDSGLKYSD